VTDQPPPPTVAWHWSAPSRCHALRYSDRRPHALPDHRLRAGLHHYPNAATRSRRPIGAPISALQPPAGIASSLCRFIRLVIDVDDGDVPDQQSELAGAMFVDLVIDALI